MSHNENSKSCQELDKATEEDDEQEFKRCTDGNRDNIRLPTSRSLPNSDGRRRQEVSKTHNKTKERCYGAAFPSCHYFKQHRPFSCDGPAPLGAHFLPPPEFPHDLQIRFLNNDSRRYKPRRQNHAESLPFTAEEYCNGDNSSSSHGGPRFSNLPENGARLKMFSNNSNRKKHYRRRKNVNSCSRERKKTLQGQSSDCERECHSKLQSDMSGQSGELPADSLPRMQFGDRLERMPSTSSCDRQDKAHSSNEVQNMSENVACNEASNSNDFLYSADCAEGAVGGIDIGGQPAVEASNHSSFSDKDLIDEGAICDFDKIFQNQEFSRCHGNGLLSSDDEYEFDRKDKTLDFHQNSQIVGAISDNGSEQENEAFENGPQVFGHGRNCLSSHHSREFSKLEYPSKSNHDVFVKSADNKELLRYSETCENYNKRQDLVSGARYLPESDGCEDTGDFIDTDLPSYNKHILSSSDEMDNLSSGNASEKDCESPPPSNNSKKYSDYNCNDLSFDEPKLLNGLKSLSVNAESSQHVPASPTNSHTAASFIHVDDSCEKKKIAAEAKVKVRSSSADRERVASGSSCSGSENGDICVLNVTMPRTDCKMTSHALQDAQLSHLDEAAASQLPSVNYVKSSTDSTSSCPRGAESGIPSQCHSQCVHPMSVCSSSASPISSCNRKNASQISAQSHAALTASSEQIPPASENRNSVIHGSASGSFSTESSACCADDAYHGQVNNLNAYCHHVHGHVANGFSHGSGGANFSNDESNQHQKIFRKLTLGDNIEDTVQHSASSADKEEQCQGTHDLLLEREKDTGGPEDPPSPDSGDSVDTVLLPMQEDIEPMHYMGGFPAGGSFDSSDEDDGGRLGFQAASNGNGVSTSSLHGSDDHQHFYPRDQNHLGPGMPSKEFYDLIKSVSASDSYMRFFDKDGHDVQRKTYTNSFSEEGNSESYQESSKADRLKVDRVMIWNEYEAYVVQYKQIAVSACGQTAVLNVMKALKFNCDKAAVCKVIKTSLRKEDADIPEYLFSRACAGTTAVELMEGVEKLSNGTVGGRFFHFWPPRKVKLLQWLAYWMKRGAIPVATLNLQQGPHSIWQIPDSWHHQMVYGVSHQGLYLTNPLEIVSERSAIKQLCSDSVLLVRRHDIVTRFRDTTDLGQLLEHPDQRWMSMNVLGQVVNVLREFNMPTVPGYRLQVTSHIAIPAFYRAGITLYMCKDKPAWSSLVNAPDLPLEASSSGQ